jgi:hypothetical protein
MEVKIVIGKRTKDLRIKHFKVIQEPSFSEEPTLAEMVQVIHLYSGVKPSLIRQYTMKEITQMYIAISKQFAGISVNSTPPKELTFDGVTYCLVNPEKIGVGWHQDFSTCTIDEPTRLAAMFYLPKGVVYGDEDEYGNLVSSIRDRSPIFAEHMELQTFIDCCAFFLRKYEKSMRESTVKKSAEILTAKILKAMRLNKKESSIGKR